VAVVGYGSIGRRHFENLGRLGVAGRVVVRRARGANPAFAPPADACVVHDDGEAIRRGLDLAIVSNPTSLHAETARRYLESGVPVLVEKPLAANEPEARGIVELADRLGVPAGVAYPLRYHPAYALAQRTITAGHLGRLLDGKAWFESYLPDWHPWEDYRHGYAARNDLGGGVLPTLDHEIDFLLWCLGRPARVQGQRWSSGTLETDVDDTASIDLQFASGLGASIMLSFGRHGRRRGFAFAGSMAALRYSEERGRLERHASERRPADLLWDGSAYDVNQMYIDMLAAALGSVASAAPSPLPIPLRAGLEALVVMNQVRPR